MATITGQVIEDSKQIDGRRHVRAKFVDSEGGSWERMFVADPEQDLLSTLAIMGQAILDSQVNVEINENMQEALVE